MAKALLEQKAMSVIPAYMISQNRPYSVLDVYTNLRQEFGKTLVQKALESAVANGCCKEKVIGKQKIYYADQDKLEKYDEAALAEYDEKIAKLVVKENNLSTQYKDVQAELRTATATETTVNLKKISVDLEEKLVDMEERVKHIEASRCTKDDSEALRVVENERKMLIEAKKRKRMATDILDVIRDNSSFTKKQLVEKIGLELEDGE